MPRQLGRRTFEDQRVSGRSPRSSTCSRRRLRLARRSRAGWYCAGRSDVAAGGCRRGTQIRSFGQRDQNWTGTDRGPRTCPPAHVTSPPSARRNSGIRCSQVSTATRSSIRARFEPAQRWMPTPKATWRLTCAIDDHLVGPVERCRVTVGGREVEQHAVTGLDRAPGDSVSSDGDARHCHRRVGAQQLLDRRGISSGSATSRRAVGRGGWRGATSPSRCSTTSCRRRPRGVGPACRGRARPAPASPSTSACSRSLIEVVAGIAPAVLDWPR